MIKLVQISSPVFSATLWQCHADCIVGQVLKLFLMRDYVLSNPKTDFERKNFFPKMAAYLKVVDKLPPDYTFSRFRGLSNGLPIPVAGS